MIVIDITNNYVLASSTDIRKVNERGEIGIIKVYVDGANDWYIGTDYTTAEIITDDILVPDPNKQYYWDNGVFIEVPAIPKPPYL
jgi:hypothetical protein